MDSRKKPPSEAAPHKESQSQGSESAGDAATNVATSTTPDDNCVLFGRGKACNNHPGNKRMRIVIGRYRDEYQAAERGVKKLTVLKVHEELVEEGMKFLKQEEGTKGWVEADADEVIRKVGHAIRSIRSRCKSEASSNDDQPRAAALAASAPFAMGPQVSAGPGQMLQDNLVRVAGANVTSSLALTSARTAAGFPSADALQQLLGRSTTSTIGSNPLLSQSIPMQSNNGLSPSLLASMGLAQPSPPSMAPNGLSAVEIYVLMERERQLQQAILYDQILRNAKKR